MVSQSQDEIEERQSSLAALIKNKNDLILVYNSKLGTQQKYLDKLKQELAYMEQRMEERDKTGKERSRMIGETKLAINNIFDRLVSYNSTRPSTGGFGASSIMITDADKPGVNTPSSLAVGGGAGLTANWANPGDDPLLREGDLSPSSLAEKLHFIQERVMDLTAISVKAEHAIAQEKIERQRKQAALQAALAENFDEMATYIPSTQSTPSLDPYAPSDSESEASFSALPGPHSGLNSDVKGSIVEPPKKKKLGNLSAKQVGSGEFEAENTFTRGFSTPTSTRSSRPSSPSETNASSRYTHLNPQVNFDVLKNLLESSQSTFNGPDRTCSMLWVVIDATFREMIQQADKSLGDLAVVYDKNPMEATGYAAVMADHTKEKVWLAEYYEDDPSPPVKWVDGVMYLRDKEKEWHPIRACFRYVTQKPWNRFPINSKTIVLNSLDGSGLSVRIPETIRNVTKGEIPLWLDSMGGHAVLKVPYSNAGQGVYTITNKQELKEFMETEHHYDKFIVQSLVGNASWSSNTRSGKFYHVGTIPNKKNHTFVSDLRMMVAANSNGFRPVAIYARRARKPLIKHLEDDPSNSDRLSTVTSWEMLGTNLSVKTDDVWTTEAQRLLLMDRKDFNQLGIGIDDLIDAYIQTFQSLRLIKWLNV
ncbi:hypothetical protein BCR33DRAFT_736708 [Rhizoclosmatium globosum]|uniref:Uncharacterized protein n=1 Tax=Rhizoclosmatium globosum TaxID=329046 RepID=A0A1Y2CJN1_9FUNG|nr:hypothetical protein BCR33DRAFT_736708 [Rhizoclosmatium globosum]|eukprot:ORY46545.1 hypothetical protein BCR33DRAFT_736708 [Rhizoclosmatium globosum]